LEEPGVWQTLGKKKKKKRKKRGGKRGDWSLAHSGRKKKKKKKEYIHTHSYTQVVVHLSMYDGEEA
jgi:hypothetical protein